jgi:hypothetical protein
VFLVLAVFFVVHAGGNNTGQVLVTWVASLCGLDLLDAYQLVTQAVESPLANVCDTNYTSIAKMPKRYLSSASGAVMDGAHARLRHLAASYGG